MRELEVGINRVLWKIDCLQQEFARLKTEHAQLAIIEYRQSGQMLPKELSA
jgi:hypothetical protein